MTEIRRIDGVVLSNEDARDLADALVMFTHVLRQVGSKAGPKVIRLRSQLLTAVGVSKTASSASLSEGVAADGRRLRHDLISTTEAGAILGCSAANVRDLAKRGRLDGQLVGGRWLVTAESVRQRRERP
ncbi:helix-turn-helix domain-containing protein [Rhodococcus qingshengii]|uniref:helix-turn-helix domain-containing protein n=1 Tax=Rhodococcus qingshengii TaxID=334542 RepID=UPI0035A582E4